MFLRKAKVELTNLSINLMKARSDQNADPRTRRKLEELIIIIRNCSAMVDKIMNTAVPRKTNDQLARESVEKDRKKRSETCRWQMTF